MAGDLRQAGLQRVNVSLDTLQPERFRKITRYGNLKQVMAGIEAAERAGLTPIKINAVVVRGFNDDEIPAISALTQQHDWHVRFIELMPVGTEEACLPGVCDGSSRGQAFVSASEMRERIEQELGVLAPASKAPVGNGPASYYSLTGASGTVGFISAISEHFCFRCNRLRLTADGNLRPCLMADGEIDLKTPMRAGACDADLEALILEAVAAKPERHHLVENEHPLSRTMAQIGG
jgi:cyclic pyranopterin phosphate synthase